MPDSRRKILLIGWDAADWKVIDALIEQDKMPHTAALIERGVMGNLTTLQPVLSPMLWTSIATGKWPFKHGILGFSEPTPDGAGIQPVSQLSRKTKAVWNILNQEGYRCNVVGWWPSHPVEPLNGVMVSNHYHTAIGPPEQPWPIAPGMIHPRRLESTLAELRLNPNELVPEQILPFIPKALEIDQDKDRRVASVMKILAECSTVHAAATWLLEHEPWDFMGVYYDAIDHFCHGFMKYHPPRREHISERDYELYHGVVETGYRFHDLMLGAMLRMVPPETTIILCSDHGFHSDHLRPQHIPNEPAGPAVEHRDLGIFLMAGPGLKQDELIHGATLLDITPTILTLYGLPVGEDMDGKPLLDAFEQPPAVKTIPSWDTVPGADARLSREQQFDPLTSKEAMDQLVALGYIEKPNANLEQAIANTLRELRYNLARSYMHASRHRDAQPILTALYEASPDQYRFAMSLALCYRALHEVAALRALIEKVTFDRQQTALEARAKLQTLQEDIRKRQLQAGQGQAQEAIDVEVLTDEERTQYNELRLLSRFNTFDLDYVMGWVLTAEGDHLGALVHLQRAARSEHRWLGLHLQIGQSYLVLRRWQEADDAFRKALALDPLNPHAHLGLARACLPRHRTEEAVEEALEAVQLLYHNPLAHYVLAQGLLRLQRAPRAAEALQVAVALNPHFERAHRLLARYYRMVTHEQDKAQEHWRIVQEIRAQGKKGVKDLEMLGADLAELAPEVDQEGQQFGFDAAPAPVVDKSAVPDDPAAYIVVVAGLPRSGTSLLMQMLAASGWPVLTDGQRVADSDNPKGYFELAAATRLQQDRAWLPEAKGKAIKIVAQLLRFLPQEHAYRVIFTERDLHEVVQSQQVMLDNLGRDRAKLSDTQLKQVYRQHIRQIKFWLARQPNIKTLFISHHDAIQNPTGVAASVNVFLGGNLDTAAMASVVDSSLYRQRAVEKVV